MNRILFAIAVVTGLLGCADVGNNDPGARMGGMMDGGDMMGKSLSLPTGPGVLTASTRSGSEALVAIDVQTIQAMPNLPFSQFRLNSVMVPGIDPGAASSVSVDARRTTLQMAVMTPPRVVTYDLVNQYVLAIADFPKSNFSDQLGRHAISGDGATVYAVDISANEVVRVAVNDGSISAIGASTVPGLSQPSAASVSPDGRVYVGSSNMAIDHYFVFDDTGTLAYNAGLSVPLVDGAMHGTRPGACVTVTGQAFMYCNAAPMTGTGGCVWKLQSGSPPKAVITGLTNMPRAIASSPHGDRLYIADGNVLRAYWLQSDPNNPVPVGTANLASAIDDIVVVGQGEALFVSSRAGNFVVKLWSFDLSEIGRLTNLDDPGPLAFLPPP